MSAPAPTARVAGPRSPYTPPDRGPSGVRSGPVRSVGAVRRPGCGRSRRAGVLVGDGGRPQAPTAVAIDHNQALPSPPVTTRAHHRTVGSQTGWTLVRPSALYDGSQCGTAGGDLTRTSPQRSVQAGSSTSPGRLAHLDGPHRTDRMPPRHLSAASRALPPDEQTGCTPQPRRTRGGANYLDPAGVRAESGRVRRSATFSTNRPGVRSCAQTCQLPKFRGRLPTRRSTNEPCGRRWHRSRTAVVRCPATTVAR